MPAVDPTVSPTPTSAPSGARSRALAPVLAVAVSLALLVLIWRPFLSTPTFNTTSAMDWRFRANYMSYTVKSIFTAHRVPLWATSDRYHQLWSPDAHGFLSNPETEVLSPYVVLYGLMPFGDAARLSLLIHLLIGVAGLYGLLTLFGVRHWPIVVLSSVLLFGSGFFVRHVLVGHLQFFSYTYFPAALWLYLRASRAPRLDRSAWASLMGSGLAIALAYYEGNIHLVIQFLVVIAALSLLLAAASPRTAVRPMAAGAVVIASFVLLAAFKLLPGIVEYGGYRPNDMNTYLSLRQFMVNVFDCVPSPPWPVPHELGFYLGIAGAIVVAAGLLAVRRATWPLAILAWVLLLVLFAPFGKWLVHVPLVATQRPTRWRSELILLAVVLSGDALARLRVAVGRWWPRGGRVFFTAALLALIALVVRDQAWAMRTLVGATRQDAIREHEGRLIALHNAAILAPAATLREGSGVLVTDSEGPNAFSIAYHGNASAGHPAVIVLPDVTSREASVALAIRGGERVDAGGHLGIRVTAPEATIAIRYSSVWMTVGLCLTGLALAAFACLLFAARRAARRERRTTNEGRAT